MIRWLIARPRVRECRSGDRSLTKFLGRDLLDHVASPLGRPTPADWLELLASDLAWAGAAGADCGDMGGGMCSTGNGYRSSTSGGRWLFADARRWELDAGALKQLFDRSIRWRNLCANPELKT